MFTTRTNDFQEALFKEKKSRLRNVKNQINKNKKKNLINGENYHMNNPLNDRFKYIH